MNNHNPNPDEQSWDVFRYVAEEMTPDEEQHFEQLLESDQALREQVANMVSTMAMVDQVHATSKVSPAVAKRAATLRVRRLIVSVAALVAIATLAVNLMPSPSQADAETDSVAMAWAESLETDEFELPEQEDNFEFASFEIDGDDDWIADVVTAVNESSVN
jgi:ferric-dicitrate binding protein FerR (iron transport regulator)